MRRILAVLAAAAFLVGGLAGEASASDPAIGSSYAAVPGMAAPNYTPVPPTLVQRGREININEAAYGARGRYCNAERAIERECNGRDRCRFRVENDLCGDPAEGVIKELRMQFSCGRDRQSVNAREGQRVELRCDRGRAEASVTGRPNAGGPGGGGRDIQVVEAVYGAAGRQCNASRPVANRCNGRDECSVRADNSLCGDPALGNPKTLVITYNCRGQQRQAVAQEGRTARLGC